MSWIIIVHPVTRDELRLLDPSLRLELFEKAAALAESRGEEVRKSRGPAEPEGRWVHEYDSDVIAGLRMVLLFDRIEGRERRLVLISIRHSMLPPSDPGK